MCMNKDNMTSEKKKTEDKGSFNSVRKKISNDCTLLVLKATRCLIQI